MTNDIRLTIDLPTSGGTRVLMIDDDPEDVEIVKDLLGRAELSQDWQLDWAPNPDDGRQRLLEGKYHVVLCDHRLGPRSGLDAIRELRAVAPVVPFILLTGSAGREIDVAAMEAGAASFLSKYDLTPELLERTIRYAVDGARSRVDLVRQARRDPLTGLHNRVSLEDRLEHAIARAERHQETKLGVAVLDLDGFKAVNDTRGHEAGDRLLRDVAKRLRSAVRPYDTVARVGGDEFVIVVEDLPDLLEAERVASRLVAAAAEPGALEKGEDAPRSPVTGSLGMALFPGCGKTVHALLQAADAAMYIAKRRGKNQAHVVRTPTESRRRRPNSSVDVREAVETGTLDLVFQPQVSLDDGQVRGVEALTRLPGDTRTDIAAFIAELERTGAIVELDRWVLETARKRLRHLPSLRVAVNLSSASLLSPGFVEGLCPVDPKSGTVEIELTERTAAADPQVAARRLSLLREMGYRVALDDFGMGHSSLHRFAHMPVDTLKIDRSLVHRVGEVTRRRSVIESILHLARLESIDVVAEGVETPEERHALEGLGVPEAQGFLFARPMPLADLEGWLAQSPPEAMPS